MAWRIGDLLDLPRQLGWIAGHGFDAASFHTSPGDGVNWRGYDAASPSAAFEADLRAVLAGFRHVELHAPFQAVRLGDWIPGPGGSTSLDPLIGLRPTLEYAGRVAADIVTVHLNAAPGVDPGHQRDALTRALGDIEAICPDGTRVGIETTRLDVMGGVAEWSSPSIGLTLDIGHFFLGNRKALSQYGQSLPALIDAWSDSVVHFHLHDVADGVDHLPPGRGEIDFAALFATTRARGYSGAFCWELNPDRASPADIHAAASFTREHFRRDYSK